MAETEDNLDEIDDLGDDLVDEDEDSDILEPELPKQSFFSRFRILIISSLIGVVFIGAITLFFLRSDNSPSQSNETVRSSMMNPSNEQMRLNKRLKKKKKKKKKRKIKYEMLFKGLDGKQLSDILRELSYENIAFTVIQNGKLFDVTVDETRLEEAKNILAIKGLPTDPIKGFELFDEASNLGVTEFDKRIRLIRALSGELEKAIMKFDSIDNAQVEIVLPEPRLFAVTQPPVTASILVRKTPDSHITDEIVYAILQLASNSVENLQPENISVVDTTGQVLSTGVLERITDKNRRARLKSRSIKAKPTLAARRGTIVEPELEDVIDWFEIKQSYESLLERKAYNQLAGVLPEGSYKIAVTVDMFPSKKMGTPDIKRLSTSIVIDSTREDINLDTYTSKQVRDTVSGAIGYVHGRDIITISRAEFINKLPEKSPVKKNKPKKVTKRETPQFVKTGLSYVKYWPIPALGLSALASVYGVLRLIMLILRPFGKIASLFSRKKEPKELDIPEPEDVDETDFSESIDAVDTAFGPPEESNDTDIDTIDSNIETFSSLATKNPEAVANLLETWLKEDQPNE